MVFLLCCISLWCVLDKLLVIKRTTLRRKLTLRQNCHVQLRSRLVLDQGEFVSN